MKRPILKYAFLVFAIALLPFASAVAGKETGNAGNPTGIAFKAIAKQAIEELSRSGLPAASHDRMLRLRKALAGARIVYVDEVLYVHSGGEVQPSVAVNEPKKKLIKLSKDWNAITDERVKRALAIHELAGLIGEEATGKYELSAEYLSFLGYGTGAKDTLGSYAGKNLAEASPEVSDAMYCQIEVGKSGGGTAFRSGDFLTSKRLAMGSFEQTTPDYGRVTGTITGGSAGQSRRVKIGAEEVVVNYTLRYELADLKFLSLDQQARTQYMCLAVEMIDKNGSTKTDCARPYDPTTWTSDSPFSSPENLNWAIANRPVLTAANGTRISVRCGDLNSQD